MSESVKNKIIKILSEQTLLEPSEIKEHLSLEDLNIDSLALVEIVFSIEETFNITIPFNANDPTNTTFDISNVNSIINAVENLIKS
ncbi:MAG: acyl carrier protein, partial [Paracoccaceae bacterium]